MKLKKLLEGINYSGDKRAINELEVTGVCGDSRKLLPGDVFVCIKGGEKNGMDYISEAEKRGAKAIICEKDVSAELSRAICVVTENTERALAVASSNYYGIPSDRLKVIGVTGTNGKTTVTAIIAEILNKIGKKCARIGTLGAEYDGEYTSISSMTTPGAELLYPLLKSYADKGAEYAVMEVSSHSLEKERVAGIDFEIGAITNVTPEHLDFHGNMESYCRAKKKLFSRCKKAVICADDYYTVSMYREISGEKISCSVKNGESDYYAEDVVYKGTDGVEFMLCHNGQKGKIVSRMPGEFAVSNCLLAVSVLCELGLDMRSVCAAMADISGVKGRMEQVNTGSDFSVIIDYAHTPDALAKVLNSVRGFRKREQRIVTLFGCGGDRDRSKRSLMGAIASGLSDFVIITSDNCRTENCADIIDEIMLGFDKSCPHVRIDDRRAAIIYAVKNAEKGDIILLCGKGHEEYEIDMFGKRPFSEKQIVLEALKKDDKQ